MWDNMKYFSLLKEVPEDALKKIKAGRIKGYSDVNPMWRIEKMTEVFWPCGIGWAVSEPIFEHIPTGNETIVSCKITLKIKQDEEWSEPIPWVGWSKSLIQEKNWPYINDEAEKMAYTDALSVAMKMIWLAADVYRWDNNNEEPTKYDAPQSYRFDLKEFIEEQIRTEEDSNHLVTLYEEAMKNKLSEKQIAWLKKECGERKDKLLNK